MSDVTVTFGAKDDGVNTTIMKIKGSLDNLENQSKKTSSSFDGSFKGMAIAGGAAGLAVAAGMKVIGAATDAARAVVNKFGDALELGDRLSELSSRTGETAGNLRILESAFENTGAGADKVGPSINKLQKFITDAANGSDKNAQMISKLGISMVDLQGKTPTQQMSVFAKAISSIVDPSERSTAAMKVFGKSGGALLPMLNDFEGEVSNAKRELGSMPGILDKSAKAFGLINDKMNVVKGKLTEFATGLLSEAIPALSKLVNAGSELDAASFGQNLGRKLSEAFELITNGDMWQIFKLNGEKAILQLQSSDALNGLVAYLNTIFDGITNPFDFNFSETLEKYLNAGRAANDEIIANIDRQIGDIWGRAAQRSQESARKYNEEVAKAQEEMARKQEAIDEKAFNDRYDKIGEAMADKLEKPKDDSQKIKENLKGGADAMDDAAASVEKAMKLSKQIAEDIDKARNENNIDKDGKLQKRINDAIDEGDFRKADRLNERIRNKEKDQELRGVDENGNRKDRRSLRDIAKDEGVDTTRKTDDQIRQEILDKRRAEREKAKPDQNKPAEDAKKRQDEMKPGNEGKKDEGQGKGKGQDDGVLTTISAAVDAIKDAVLKLEKKLPQPALGY